ncbi:hypothetical protein L226DRAFT_612921 [Lentinus tigrinus ALCF2SS1-7]|uniref:uncharacterized protein n=1 Tax=Lentinus tigrinus ALCF2SS1-7 TaxID=1328758 RepID=UPI0011660F3E|nr:hypothetical protein L226DRAFT_612921 [Lentinus tigrinus ALCF2SS1-7]
MSDGSSYAVPTEYLNWNLGVVLIGIGITGATSNAQTFVNACLTAMVQAFYCIRVWSLSKQVATVIGLGIIIAANWALGIVLFAESLMATSVEALAMLGDFSVAMSSVTAGTDIIITVILVLLLYTSRSSGSSHRSKRLIRKLMFYTINSGLLTSICALLSLITNVTMVTTNLYVLFYYIGARLYTVCMIASLNARQGLRAHIADATGITTFPYIGTVPEHSGSTHVTGGGRIRAPRSYTTLFGIRREPAISLDGPATPLTPTTSKARALEPEPGSNVGLRRVHTLTLPTRTQ